MPKQEGGGPTPRLCTVPHDTSDYRTLDPGVCKKHSVYNQETGETISTPHPLCFHCHILAMNAHIERMQAQINELQAMQGHNNLVIDALERTLDSEIEEAQ